MTAIDRLFAARITKNSTITDKRGAIRVDLCYPLRMVYGENPNRGGAPVQFLVSVPKKRLRRAVDRVAVRRRVREAYRLERGDVSLIDDNAPHYDVVFIYIANEIVDSARIRKAMTRLLANLQVSEPENARP